MIALMLLAVVGQFVSMRYRYEERMQQLEAERRALTEARSTGAGAGRERAA
jgi:hypothetical protein